MRTQRIFGLDDRAHSLTPLVPFELRGIPLVDWFGVNTNSIIVLSLNVETSSVFFSLLLHSL